MNIILDFDSCLAITHKAMFDYYQYKTKDYSVDYDESKITWNMKSLCKMWTQSQMDNIFIEKDFFEFLKLYNDVLEVLNKLKSDGHHLHIASCHRIEGMVFKQSYIEKNLPMIDEITLIPIAHGLSKLDKSSITGDIVIDDSIVALQTINCPKKICFGNFDWNKDWNGVRATNWKEVYYLINHYDEVIELTGDWNGGKES